MFDIHYVALLMKHMTVSQHQVFCEFLFFGLYTSQERRTHWGDIVFPDHRSSLYGTLTDMCLVMCPTVL